MPSACCGLRKAGATIAELEKYLGHPSSTSSTSADERSSRVFLAFLLDGQGKAELAETHWSALTAKPELNAATIAADTRFQGSWQNRDLISQRVTAPDV